MKTNFEMVLIEKNELIKLMKSVVRDELQILLTTDNVKEDLMTREEVVNLLKVTTATLWRWQNHKKVTVYKIANKCYYKRSEIMAVVDDSKQ